MISHIGDDAVAAKTSRSRESSFTSDPAIPEPSNGGYSILHHATTNFSLFPLDVLLLEF